MRRVTVRLRSRCRRNARRMPTRDAQWARRNGNSTSEPETCAWQHTCTQTHAHTAARRTDTPLRPPFAACFVLHKSTSQVSVRDPEHRRPRLVESRLQRQLAYVDAAASGQVKASTTPTRTSSASGLPSRVAPFGAAATTAASF